MTNEDAIKILKCEKECVLRQDTPKCNRDSLGCHLCDLIQETEDVLEAYDMAIESLEKKPDEIYKEGYIKGAIDNGGSVSSIADNLFNKLMGGGT